jgi:signal transduction histidine kinase
LRIKNQAGRHRDLESNWTHAFLKQAAGEIWVGTIFGAFAFDPHIIDPDDMMFRHLSQFEHESISGFQRTRDGTLWVGTHNAGLYKITDRPEQVIRVRYDPADPASVGNDRIRALHEDDRGNFWVGTSGGGLWRVEQSSGRSRSYTETDGLAGNAVEGIVSDGSGALWVSTNNGLSCFDPATDRFRTYRQIDGLPTNRFRGDGARTRTGELVFGTAADGIVIFHPDSLGDDARPPGVFITVLNTYGSDVNALPHGGDRSGLVLPHSQRSFTIEYLALDCTAPEKNLYFHKLDGFNAEWVPAGTRRSVTYRNLEPGEYAFHVKGSNSDGVWAEASAPLRLTILPPYWRTWWFYTLSGAFVTGLLFSAHKYRLRKALEMERLRIRIASDLHDDLGSNLSGIALLTDLVGDQLTPGAERDRLAFVSRTARQMADTLKDLVWTINPGNDTFDNLALRMKDTAATLLNGIDHTFVGAERPLPLKLPIEARRNLYLTYKEILHNIVKHSKAGRVEITFAETGGRLVLTVADDGVGFRQEDVVSGSGLGNIRARARAAGGEAVVDSRPGGGTRISVDIKIP